MPVYIINCSRKGDAEMGIWGAQIVGDGRGRRECAALRARRS